MPGSWCWFLRPITTQAAGHCPFIMHKQLINIYLYLMVHDQKARRIWAKFQKLAFVSPAIRTRIRKLANVHGPRQRSRPPATTACCSPRFGDQNTDSHAHKCRGRRRIQASHEFMRFRIRRCRNRQTRTAPCAALASTCRRAHRYEFNGDATRCGKVPLSLVGHGVRRCTGWPVVGPYLKTFTAPRWACYARAPWWPADDVSMVRRPPHLPASTCRRGLLQRFSGQDSLPPPTGSMSVGSKWSVQVVISVFVLQFANHAKVPLPPD